MNNLDTYKERFRQGYGLQYPDGHVIRIWENVLKRKYGMTGTGQTMLDFGCWTGTHTNYFSDKGFDAYGVDIVPGAIGVAKAGVFPEWAARRHFFTITDETDLEDLLPVQFDLIFCNQVLYFLDDKTLAKRLAEFERFLKSGGFFVATLMSDRNVFWRYAKAERTNGLWEIDFAGSDYHLQGKYYVRFTNSPRHAFPMFDCLQIGEYDISLELGRSGHHWIYIGRKRV